MKIENGIQERNFIRHCLKHRRFPSDGRLSLETDEIVVLKSQPNSVLILFLKEEMDSTPSKTHGAPKVYKFDSCNKDFPKIPSDFLKMVSEKPPCSA